jgi:hypothetical protein
MELCNARFDPRMTNIWMAGLGPINWHYSDLLDITPIMKIKISNFKGIRKRTSLLHRDYSP